MRALASVVSAVRAAGVAHAATSKSGVRRREERRLRPFMGEDHTRGDAGWRLGATQDVRPTTMRADGFSASYEVLRGPIADRAPGDHRAGTNEGHAPSRPGSATCQRSDRPLTLTGGGSPPVQSSTAEVVK